MAEVIEMYQGIPSDWVYHRGDIYIANLNPYTGQNKAEYVRLSFCRTTSFAIVHIVAKTKSLSNSFDVPDTSPYVRVSPNTFR